MDTATVRAKALSWGKDLALLVGAVAAIHLYQTRGVPSGAAPAIESVGLDGKKLSLAAYRGKPVLVHFWATWCGVCKEEEPGIVDLAQDHPVLSVAVQSGDFDKVGAYAQAHHLPYPVVNDMAGEFSQAYGVHAFPTSVILDGQGHVKFAEVGFTSELGLRARMWLAGL
jgi:thiol-disulfide isomerase/thioredoxin